MEARKTLTELAVELDRIQNSKVDYVADTRHMEMQANGDIELNFPLSTDIRYRDFAMTDHSHGQVADRLKIPQKYYKRMLEESPALLAENVNHWFGVQPEKRMIRTLDGRARAFLSERYRPIDNYDIAERILPVLHEKGVKIQSCELTEKRMYIIAIHENIQAEVKQGDVIQAGVIISNSEVGSGAAFVSSYLWRLVCSNGMKRQEVIRSIHLGGRHEEGQYFKHDTMDKRAQALALEMRDSVDNLLSEDGLHERIDDRLAHQQ